MKAIYWKLGVVAVILIALFWFLPEQGVFLFASQQVIELNLGEGDTTENGICMRITDQPYRGLLSTKTLWGAEETIRVRATIGGTTLEREYDPNEGGYGELVIGTYGTQYTKVANFFCVPPDDFPRQYLNGDTYTYQITAYGEQDCNCHQKTITPGYTDFLLKITGLCPGVSNKAEKNNHTFQFVECTIPPMKGNIGSVMLVVDEDNYYTIQVGSNPVETVGGWVHIYSSSNNGNEFWVNVKVFEEEPLLSYEWMCDTPGTFREGDPGPEMECWQKFSTMYDTYTGQDTLSEQERMLLDMPYCGDGSCDLHEEGTWDCVCDCGEPPPVCGDDHCSGGEDYFSCKVDCEKPPNCGDGVCGDYESPHNCPEDCKQICNDGQCTVGEDCLSCPYDCGECPPVPECGDGICDPSEDDVSCPYDCALPEPECGDGICSFTETCISCAQDCGTCDGKPDWCGNGICGGEEDCQICKEDCGECELPPPIIPGGRDDFWLLIAIIAGIVLIALILKPRVIIKNG